MERLIAQHSGNGRLTLEDGESVRVTYQIDEFQESVSDGASGERPTIPNIRGKVIHGEGHPNWHPIVSLHPGPFTLVMNDGRKLTVVMETEPGAVRGTSGFF